MQGRRWIRASLGAWSAAWAFWLLATRRSHQSLTLAVIVTTAVVAAYATAAYVNHLALIPRLWRAGHRAGYVAWLAVVMVGLTASALVIIRAAYHGLAGPDSDPNGVYKHFAIDLCGMAVHLAAVLALVGAVRRATGRAQRYDAADPAARSAGLWR